MVGELEKCASAASHLETGRLASATRNLFELSFVADYVCASNTNMERFIVDAAIDELEIMEKFLAIDQQCASYRQDQESKQRSRSLKTQIATAGLTGKKPLDAFAIAQTVNRETEYRALHKVYSKMSHATAWAILGACVWEKMTLLLLSNANGYAAECIRHISLKTALPTNTPMPKS
jgi:hypothetical protein